MMNKTTNTVGYHTASQCWCFCRLFLIVASTAVIAYSVGYNASASHVEELVDERSLQRFKECLLIMDSRGIIDHVKLDNMRATFGKGSEGNAESPPARNWPE